MGFATLMIIVCHASASDVLMPYWLNRLMDQGNYGVDIFLLLSGLGLYYSLKKNPTNTITEGINYYKKRGYRILIPYWMVYVPYCVIFFLLGLYTKIDSLLCLSTLEFWLYHRGAWFVSLILILYLLAPLLYKVLDKKCKWFYIFGNIALIMILCQVESGETVNDNILQNIQGALSRVPSFLIGMAIGQECQEKKQISSLWLFLLFLTGYFFMKTLPHGECAIWMVIPLMLYIIIVALKWTEQFLWIDKILIFMGTISLESYLMNISLNSLLKELISRYGNSNIFYGHYLQYSIVIFIGISVAYYINKFSKPILAKLSKSVKNQV